MSDRSSLPLVLIFAVFGCSAILKAAVAPPNPATNAALDYWPAIYFMTNWTSPDRDRLDHADSMALDGAAKKLLEDAGTELRSLRHGAEDQICDWGLHVDQEGPHTLLPYLDELAALGEIGTLQARFDMRDRKYDAAVQDWSDVLALARHAGSDGSMVSLRVSYGIQNRTLSAAAATLGQLDAPSLLHFSQLLDALPEEVPLSQTVRFHQRIGQQWMIRQLHGNAHWRETLLSNSTQPSAAIRAAVEAAGGTEDALIAKLQELNSLYDQMADLASQPYEQSQQSWPELEQKFTANPTSIFTGAHVTQRFCQEAAVAQARMALFEAAVAVLQSGPKTLADHLDPDSPGQPFAYVANPDGFELASNLSDEDGHPITLRVAGKKAP